jgi:hypothetical protein
LQDRKDLQVLLAAKAHKVLQVPQVLLAMMAAKVPKATLEPLAHKVLQVPQVLLAMMAAKVPKATLEPRAHKVPPELQPQFFTQWLHQFRQVAPATR